MISNEFRKALQTAPLSEILGQDSAKEEIKSALFAGKHIILVGPPGVGKTTLAKSVAGLLPERKVNDCLFHCSPDNPCHQCKNKKPKTKILPQAFVRVQGSPDLTAEDLLGDIDPMRAMKYGPLSLEAFTPGKIFKANNGILFFDEVNRCTEKLQNALLQVLEEERATIGSYDVDLPASFIFIGTMNPEDTSTEKLSDVFLDRFDLVTMGYPETSAVEDDIVTSQRIALEGVTIESELQNKVIAFIRQLRMDKNIDKKPSVRASICVIDRSLSTAFLRGHKKVFPEDIIAVIPSVLSHRISLKPSVKYLEDPEKYLMKQFQAFARDHDLEGGDP